jgi:hypothetical protein
MKRRPAAWRRSYIQFVGTGREWKARRQKRTYRYRCYRCYRCYLTPTQAAVLARTFGCARFVDNWALRWRTDASSDRQERLSY